MDKRLATIIAQPELRNVLRVAVLVHLERAGGRATFADTQLALGIRTSEQLRYHARPLQDAGFIVRGGQNHCHLNFSLTRPGRAALAAWRKAIGAESNPQKRGARVTEEPAA